MIRQAERGRGIEKPRFTLYRYDIKYGYDKRNRLTWIEGSNERGEFTEKLTYDHAGNRISRENISRGRTACEILEQYSYEYDAFGKIIEATEHVRNRFTYTGQQYDAVTQQYYLRARFYNPVIARFLQEDTYLGDGLNLYAYCQNNPLKYYDPTGHDCGKKTNSFNSSETSYVSYKVAGLTHYNTKESKSRVARVLSSIHQ